MGVPQRQLGAKVDKEQEQESLAGVLLPHWVGGKDAALDVTVVNPCQGENGDQMGTKNRGSSGKVAEKTI